MLEHSATGASANSAQWVKRPDTIRAHRNQMTKGFTPGPALKPSPATSGNKNVDTASSA
jgi:hypothetical protein